jgi:hypothetical protein
MVGADHPPLHGCPETYNTSDPCILFDIAFII